MAGLLPITAAPRATPSNEVPTLGSEVASARKPQNQLNVNFLPQFQLR